MILVASENIIYPKEHKPNIFRRLSNWWYGAPPSSLLVYEHENKGSSSSLASSKEDERNDSDIQDNLSSLSSNFSLSTSETLREEDMENSQTVDSRYTELMEKNERYRLQNEDLLSKLKSNEEKAKKLKEQNSQQQEKLANYKIKKKQAETEVIKTKHSVTCYQQIAEDSQEKEIKLIFILEP